jgi:hypothetical protein
MDIAVREQLAILILGTDILRAHAGRLTAERLREQRESMQCAARRLAGALNLPALES